MSPAVSRLVTSLFRSAKGVITPGRKAGKAMLVSSFRSTKKYEVHPQELCCSCPDWRKRRAAFQKSDPRRMCKHLVRAYVEQPNAFPGSLGRYRDYLSYLFTGWRGFDPKMNCRALTLDDGTAVEAWWSGTTRWAQVFVGSESFILAPGNRTWLKDRKPKQAEEITGRLFDGGGNPWKSPGKPTPKEKGPRGT